MKISSMIVLAGFLGAAALATTAIIQNESNENTDKICSDAATSFIRLSTEMSEKFKVTKSSKEVLSLYKEKYEDKLRELDEVGNKHQKCRRLIKAAVSEALLITKEIENDEKAKALAPKNKTSAELVNYSEWFTLTKVGAKAGKKYKFLACFTGGNYNRTSEPFLERNVCSSKKPIYYSTDLIESKEMHIKVVNTENEIKCVTAFITGNEGFLFSITNVEDCE